MRDNFNHLTREIHEARSSNLDKFCVTPWREEVFFSSIRICFSFSHRNNTAPVVIMSAGERTDERSVTDSRYHSLYLISPEKMYANVANKYYYQKGILSVHSMCQLLNAVRWLVPLGLLQPLDELNVVFLAEGSRGGGKKKREKREKKEKNFAWKEDRSFREFQSDREIDPVCRLSVNSSVSFFTWTEATARVIVEATQGSRLSMMQFRLLFLFAVTLAIARGTEDCQQGVGDTLIWEYDVRRPHRSGGYQEVNAEYGPTEARITCMRIDSLSKEDNGAAWVTSGGIGHNFVKLKFSSRYSKGLHYRVFVYGLPILTRGSL